MEIAWWKGQIYVMQNISFKRKKKGATIGNWEVIIFFYISRDFKNCMVIRAIYFKVFVLANR